MSKRSNPYTDGSAYGAIFDLIRGSKGQTVTRKELIEAGYSISDITVVLSPRDESQCKGDCRGNMSAQGHVYYLKVLGQGREKKFRLCWRKVALNKLKRAKKEVVAPVKTKAKAKETKETKVKKAKTKVTKAKAKVKKAKTEVAEVQVDQVAEVAQADQVAEVAENTTA